MERSSSWTFSPCWCFLSTTTSCYVQYIQYPLYFMLVPNFMAEANQNTVCFRQYFKRWTDPFQTSCTHLRSRKICEEATLQQQHFFNYQPWFTWKRFNHNLSSAQWLVAIFLGAVFFSLLHYVWRELHLPANFSWPCNLCHGWQVSLKHSPGCVSLVISSKNFYLFIIWFSSHPQSYTTMTTCPTQTMDTSTLNSSLRRIALAQGMSCTLRVTH